MISTRFHFQTQYMHVRIDNDFKNTKKKKQKQNKERKKDNLSGRGNYFGGGYCSLSARASVL